ncbi:PorP/SprF family type IX secretion system membrane protein [Parachryseolinea silvisoli]|uniref:PorP/SprF family type IX secretion system membrane protein n=1 Tax=Parachryseolinea silvisoli TaxID=2873601 RepID=UPI002265A8B4|nr:type IX secretion system membrane protein PorP/SprF [Parachryseolinea silvisoli]MCD9014524.1 type IX secretion system membrane protein PorP/SprF [Parachryseolinea silvisoli]
MYRIILLSCALILVLEGAVTAQDPQFSQFYAAPLYLNPALAGGTNQARAGLNYRNQWPSIDANFTTLSAYFDYFIEDYNSGIGVILSQDREGLAGLRSLSLGLQYSYELSITKELGFRPGVQIGIFNRDVNFDKLTFGDQYDPNTGQLISQQTAETFKTQSARTFVDLSFGGVFFTKSAWLGVSAWHLTQPNQSLIGEESKLPVKLSLHGGFKFFMKPGTTGSGVYARKAERSISPAFQYRHQGEWDQMDLGLYFTFEPLVLGTWYRGVPFKKVGDAVNNESIVLLIGFTQIGAKDAINIGYSYDYTISKLGTGSGGAHEFSLVYTWPMRNPRKPPKDKLMIPCPDF